MACFSSRTLTLLIGTLAAISRVNAARLSAGAAWAQRGRGSARHGHRARAAPLGTRTCTGAARLGTGTGAGAAAGSLAGLGGWFWPGTLMVATGTAAVVLRVGAGRACGRAIRGHHQLPRPITAIAAWDEHAADQGGVQEHGDGQPYAELLERREFPLARSR